jgi:hypothetical protein
MARAAPDLDLEGAVPRRFPLARLRRDQVACFRVRGQVKVVDVE